MFEKLLSNDFFKNVDIINTTNKILVDRVSIDDAIKLFLRDKKSKDEVEKILLQISKNEKTDISKLSMKKKAPYIKELNSVLTTQINSLW